ncbi:MAG: hypothetical protein FWG29_11635, partial [Treponema sp.]|nr:hypothetical protein [Treponema sp.]
MIREKRLVLRCIPFMKNGVGSAWGLPVVAAGKERLSARSLSEKLQAPGIVSFGSDPFREEHLRELEALGIGPLGRYLGGEPIKPVQLGPDDFFNTPAGRRKTGEQAEKAGTISAAELFCTEAEFEETHWIADGPVSDLFISHLEFLRTWGFSGGLIINEATLAKLLADYIIYLQKETEKENTKIIVLIAKHFYETQLIAQLPHSKVSGDPAVKEIPINFCAGNIPVLSREMSGLGIAFYEDLDPMLRTHKARCDILIAVNTGSPENRRSNAVYTGEITARLTLTVSTTAGKSQKNKPSEKNKSSLNNYLFRNCSETLPFPASRKTDSVIAVDFRTDLKRNDNRTDEGVAKTGGCIFTVNTKFSGLRAVDFKEEQAMYYCDAPAVKQTKVHGEPPVKPGPPPVKNNASFIGLNQTQLEFFLRWRSECRRGYIYIPPDSIYIETYIMLYADELVLCMGKEGPLQHFTALLHLLHACTEHYPETSARLCKYCVDFAVIYGIDSDAFPLLLNELFNNKWFSEAHNEIADTENLLVDLALCYFFIEAENNFDKQEYWPLIKRLIPPKILVRKDNDKDLPEQFFRTLGILDAQLRKDWNRSFFLLFFPPFLQSYDCNAFENSRSMGDSSYTVLRPGFSSHKALRDILSALTLT